MDAKQKKSMNIQVTRRKQARYEELLKALPPKTWSATHKPDYTGRQGGGESIGQRNISPVPYHERGNQGLKEKD